MSALLARKVIQSAFISIPGLREKTPAEIVSIINLQIQTKQDDNSASIPVTVGYIKSNLRGVYYMIICDICGHKCRKSYRKDVYINNELKSKILCGKCARITYKRKSFTERLAIRYLINPHEFAQIMQNPDSMSMSQTLACLEAISLQDEIRERAGRLIDKAKGKSQLDVVE